MTDLAELLARVESASSWDPQLDRDILLALGMKEEGQHWWWPDDEDRRFFGGKPHITESIDAAVVLCERVLPEWFWTIDKQAEDYHAHVAGPPSSWGAYCATPALALCTAILKAVASRGRS